MKPATATVAPMESTTQRDVLASAAEDIEFLPAPASGRGRAGARPRRRKSSPSLPETLGAYLLIEQLGSGGMGDVFKAVRAEENPLEGPRQFFAVKRIRAEIGQQRELVKRLMDEARITALLNHPNIVRVFDLQQVDRSYFIVMEYLDGADLAGVLRALRRTRMSLRAAPVAAIGAQVARGLHYAHTFADASGRPCRIVHRDISPSNVMLLRDGGVKVVDFGVAKASEMLRTTETMPGTIRGKPAYFSPEQARGEDLDGRSDIFSLGVTLWELLTGRRLFPGSTSFDRLKALLSTSVEAPSVHRPGIPPAIDRIVLRALEKDRARRYQTAAELAQDLETFLRTSPVRKDALPYVLRTLFRAARTGLMPVSSDTLSTPVTKSLTDPAANPRPAVLTLPVGRPTSLGRRQDDELAIIRSSDPTIGGASRPHSSHPVPVSEVTPLRRAASGMFGARPSLEELPTLPPEEAPLDSVILAPLPVLPFPASTPLPAPRPPSGPWPRVPTGRLPRLGSGPLPLVSSADTVPAGEALVLDFGTHLPRPRRRGLRWFAGVAGLALGLAGAQIAQRWPGSPWRDSRVSAPEATAPATAHLTPPPEVVSVRLDLRSSPAGATVSSSTGVLGPTPLLLMRARGAPTERFTFQKEGYETEILDLPSDQDTVVQVSLRPLASPGSSHAGGPDAGTSTEGGGAANGRPGHAGGALPDAKGSSAHGPSHREPRAAAPREPMRRAPSPARTARR